MPLIKALPTGTIVGDTDTQTLTNKTIASGSNTIDGKQLVGTATNDVASAGNIGEHISSTVAVGSAVGILNGTPTNLTSISLTAGDWDVSGLITYIPAGTTNVTLLQASVSTTSATTDLNPGKIITWSYPSAGAVGMNSLSVVVPKIRLSLSSTTTVYVVGLAGFLVSTMTMFGGIWARRVR